jgi:hypothetical protein
MWPGMARGGEQGRREAQQSAIAELSQHYGNFFKKWRCLKGSE